MNYETYQTIRGYCWQDLGDFIDGQARNLASVIGGELDVMKYERDAAMELYQCSDLTPRERAAAHLLAVASNHRAIAWQREDDSPGGVPAAPLEPWQAAQLDRQTSEALTKYGAFIPEREAVALLTPTAAPVLVAAPGQDTATPAPAQTVAPVVAATVELAAGAPESKPQETARPTPLTTGDIAHCFALLRWNEQQWKDTLGEVKSRKWLQECVVIPSSGRGGNETRWNPVFIAGWLVQQGHVTCRSARAKFQVNSLLNHWLDEWKTYEADNLESD